MGTSDVKFNGRVLRLPTIEAGRRHSIEVKKGEDRRYNTISLERESLSQEVKSEENLESFTICNFVKVLRVLNSKMKIFTLIVITSF